MPNNMQRMWFYANMSLQKNLPKYNYPVYAPPNLTPRRPWGLSWQILVKLASVFPLP